jgi:hypothetical protein
MEYIGDSHLAMLHVWLGDLRCPASSLWLPPNATATIVTSDAWTMGLFFFHIKSMQERLRWQQSGTVHLGRDFLGCCSEANSGAEVTGKILGEPCC